MKNLSNAAYIPQIDGLRAVAVLSVIFFHFQMDYFSGGYVGVDIFFVISGYLITGLLTKKIADGSGSLDLKAFYLRRIRRLFPALLVVVIASFICAYWLFDPENMRRFSGASIASLLSLSNVYFFSESGYFDSNAYLKPLLHMWSLSVEEQFYLFWPLLLTLFWRRTLVFVISAIIISFVLCVYFIVTHPSATFFMMPFRIYEFGIGAALVWCSTTKTSAAAKEVLGTIGFLAIAYSVFTFTEEMIFPGVNALIPCIGAALIIYSRESRMVKSTLGGQTIVHLGLLSYSLYLVHWPLVVFYKFYNDTTYEKLNFNEILILLVSTYILAWLLHKMVETRFRYASNPKSNLSFGAGCSAITVLLIAISSSAWLQSGWPNRFPGIPEDLRAKLILPSEAHADYAYRNIVKMSKPFSDSNETKVLLIGDSQAGDFANMLVENGIDKHVDLKSLVIGAKCQPVFASDEVLERRVPDKYKRMCTKQRERYTQAASVTNADVIVIIANWRDWAISELAGTLAKLEERTNAKILVLGRKNQGKGGSELILEHQKRLGLEKLASNYLDPEILKQNSELERATGKHGYLDLMSLICPNAEHCQVLTQDGDVIFYDHSHVTVAGAKYLGELMKRQGLLDEIIHDQK